MKQENKYLKFLKKNYLLVSILVSIFIGFCLGIGLKKIEWTDDDSKLWFILPGKLFIRSLELFIIPIVFLGVVSATSSLSLKSNLKFTLVGIGLCLFKHLLSTSIGLGGSFILVYFSKIQQNNSTIFATNLTYTKQKIPYDIVADILRNLIPKNIIKAAVSQELTNYYPNEKVQNESPTFTRKVEYVDGGNILGILAFGILVGFASNILGKKVQIFQDFIRSFNDVIILCLTWLIMLAPAGVSSLIIEAVLEIEEFGSSFKRLGIFTLICSISLIFYSTIVVSLLFIIVVRKNPIKYYVHFSEPALFAFATTSGYVCIQKGIEVCEKKIGMDPRISRFSIPFFSILERSGSSIFIIISCVFLAIYSGRTLEAGDYATIMIMTNILCLFLNYNI